MARQQDQAAGHQRLVTLVAVAGLAAATALAFGRVFLGRAPTWGLVAAAMASVLLATALERRGLFLALLASAVGLAFALTWIVLPQTSWYGLPSLRTLRAVGRSLEVVGQQARVQVAPTPPLPPLMLASVTAVWTASFSIHALVARAGSPLLAVLPSVALVGFADAVMDDGTRPVYAVIVLGAALAVVFVDGLRRIRLWGPIWTSLKSRRLASVTSRGARRVALLAIAVAILVPGLLPGFRSDALVDFSTSGEGGIRLDPFVSIHAQLEDRAAVDLFSVVADDDAYWRLYALDRFDGLTWSSSDPEVTQGLTFATPARLPTDFPTDSEPLEQRYRVLTDLDDPWIPMAYPPESIALPLGEVRYDSELGAAVVDGGLEEGLEYAVTSRVVSPDPRDLDAVRLLQPGRYGRYTFIPADVDPRIGEIASQWVAGEPTPYRQVLALQRRFHEAPFRYELDVDTVADADAILTFLTETQEGFCQQFATTMALMVRELGYPARVAVGYRAGRSDGGTFTVRTSDAHAWVEVLFPGYGWLAFEPTPGRTLPTAAEEGTYQNPGNALDQAEGRTGRTGTDAGVREGPGGTCTDAAGRPLPSQLCNADPLVGNRPVRDVGPVPGGLFDQPTPTEEGGYSVPYAKILLVLLMVAAIVLVLVPIVKGAWRGLLIRRSHEPRALVLAAYRVFDGEAADLGVGRRAGETLEEHRARLAAAVAFSDGHLDRLTRTASRAAYGAMEPTAEEARLAVSDARTAVRDLRRDAGWLRRVAGTYRPGL